MTTDTRPTIHLRRSFGGLLHGTSDNGDCHWLEHYTRGYTDPGPSCDECGACECATVAECYCDCAEAGTAIDPDALSCDYEAHGKVDGDDCIGYRDPQCVGLSSALVCLDGGEAYCWECAEKLFRIIIEEEGN